MERRNVLHYNNRAFLLSSQPQVTPRELLGTWQANQRSRGGLSHFAIQVVLGHTFDHRPGLDHRNGPQSIDRLETDAPISMPQEFYQNLDCSWILKSPKFSDRILAGRRKILRLVRRHQVFGFQGVALGRLILGHPVQALDQRVGRVKTGPNVAFDEIPKKIKIRIGFKLLQRVQIRRSTCLRIGGGFSDRQVEERS